MLMMNWSNPRHNEQPFAAGKQQQEHAQTDWMISTDIHAPFECIRVYSEGLKNITEVASIDSVEKQFINGGGSITRPKMHIPGIGSLISCRDCAGHTFSFFETELQIRPEKITGIG
ncbi:MAG: hypothetical protein Q9M82_01050 [Mariprofundus sp.]|nr:hypothetical protein [Mariprofundus sp.]